MWIHLAADILKDVVLLTAALLSTLKIVDGRTSDAIAALVILSLIVFGLLWTIPSMWSTATVIIWGAEALPKSVYADEEEPLLSGLATYANPAIRLEVEAPAES